MTGSPDLYDAVFRHSPIAMALIRADGSVVLANPSFAELARSCGFPSVPGRLWDCLAESDRRSSIDRVATMDLPGDRYSWLVHVGTRKREVLWQLDVSVISGSGRSQLLLVNSRDVTLQKRTEERLQRAKEAAEQATRTKSSFLANVSHEIRTPIHTITGMTDLLLETGLDEEQREYANQVRFAAEVLLYLINDILDFSKIEAGRLSLETIDFDLVPTVEDAFDMISLQAHRKGLETVVWMGSGLPGTVRGDPGRLRQIIVNLVNNAVKFTHSGGEVVLTAQALEELDGQCTVRFEVSDTGIGIPAEKLDNLFRAFSQADSSTTRKYGGTGLGLSISQGLTQLMGGRIGVNSVHEEGSTFWFEIPFQVAVRAEAVPQVCDGRRVLVIDDHARSQQAIGDYLERWGARPAIVSTGQDGLSALRDAVRAGDPFDLALIDLELPGMDGWQLASEINADKLVNATSLILLSPTGLMAGEAKMKRLMWFNGYARKPIGMRELEAEIVKALSVDLELAAVEDDDEPAEEITPLSARLVVAEDHLVNQTLFRTILEKLGHRVILVTDGKEAVDAVVREQPDLVFMDVQMPEMNGLEATEVIRQAGYRGPVVAVTANAAKGERDRCLAAGMDDFLAKPFKREDLIPLLDKWVGINDTGTDDDTHDSKLVHGDPETEMPDAEPFDFAGAVERFAGNETVVRSVIDRFIEKCETIVREFETCLESSDYERLEREAHGLKGGARSLEARPLGDAAALVEAAARMTDEARCRQSIDGLREPLARFVTAAGRYGARQREQA